jgi:hypothetical protein
MTRRARKAPKRANKKEAGPGTREPPSKETGEKTTPGIINKRPIIKENRAAVCRVKSERISKV